ncbi:hypothetical protein PIROE2DRAFT_69595 [Piromyces sp. E2]|nr:hypothetical protein PIROE2DRAFT_69595 [Piromyces sp. E2]|eukprot:OUM61599.1 hypothetical protein PIROE2DRAFT_69595 [Piromyces sp. E2]
MVRIKSLNEKLISYLSSDKNNDDLIDDSMLFKEKFHTKREENTMVSPTSDIKNVSYPTRNRRTSSYYRGKQKNGYQCKRSNLHYSFTPDSLIAEAEEKPEILTTTAMTAVVKRKKSTKGFFSSITKKLLTSKRSSISRRYSCHIQRGKSFKKNNTKILNYHSLNRNVSNIPMPVVETLYTISFTKHSYYIQRSLRRSTMIVNLITRFRQNYEELREIDVPKLKRRISFKRRVPKTVKRADQPKEGSLIDLREQRKAKYYSLFGNTLAYSSNYYYNGNYMPTYSDYPNNINTVSTMETMETMETMNSMNSMNTINTINTNAMVDTMNTESVVNSVSHVSPRRRKRIPRKPLLEFSECESLPSIPASAAGSKVNQYLASHKETERKKLKPIKSIDKELCIIFNKEYIPEDKINQKNENESVTKIHKGCSLDRNTIHKQQQQQRREECATYSKHTSLNFNSLPPLQQFIPIPTFDEPEGSSELGPEDISIFNEEEEEEEEIEETEAVKKPETIPSPSSATTEVYIPEEEEDVQKERKRISEGTLYNEALDEKHPGNVSAESDSSDKTLKDEDICIPSNDSSFLVVDENIHQINFELDADDDDDNDNDDKKEENVYHGDAKKQKSFSLTESFLLSKSSSEDSIIPEQMSNFLLNKSHFSLSDDDFFNDSMSILNNSIINESFTLTLNQYGDENKSKSSVKQSLNIDTTPSFLLKNDEKPLNRIDSGVDLSGMENISFLMATQCQI